MPLKIVIIGAGFAGLEIATSIDDLAASGAADVTIIERKSAFSIGGLNQYVLDGRMASTDVPIPYSKVRFQAVKFVQTEVQRVDTASKVVVTASHSFPYDELVICCGVEARKDVVKGSTWLCCHQ